MVSAAGARALALALAAIATACTTPRSGPTDASAAAAPADSAKLEIPVAGTALPAGYRIDTSHSLILGDGNAWTGRLAYTAGGTADDVFDFLRREMPKFGWTETYAVRSEVDLLGFSSEPTARVANIRIERGSVLDSTRVEMIVSPATSGKAPPARPKPAASR